VYPARSYDAETVVAALVNHYTSFGLFDFIVSYPGSAFMSKVVSELNGMFVIRHKVSLVGRHESNGVEGTIKQFLRHLRTYVFDTRLIDRWSSVAVLPLINFALNNRPTPETGGFTPFQLKYGTQDAEYFRLPLDITPGQRVSETLKLLDEDLRIIRELSSNAQAELVAERKKLDSAPASYAVGDLVLWNPREMPTEDVFHLSRLKPFFGSYTEAVEMAKLDNNQFDIASINYFTGNPHVRTSMSFNVTFNIGQSTETVNLNYTNDLARSQQFQDYIETKAYLFPLRSTEKVSRQHISNLKKLAIIDVKINDELYLNLRYYDGTHSSWYDSLELPYKDKDYVIKIKLIRWLNKAHTAVLCQCPVFNDNITLNSYDVFALTTPLNSFDDTKMLHVTATMRSVFPKIFAV
jgi:hypothetical protein